MKVPSNYKKDDCRQCTWREDVLKGFFALAYVAILASLSFSLFDKNINSLVSFFKDRGGVVVEQGDLIDAKYAPIQQFNYTIEPAQTLSLAQWVELKRFLNKSRFEELNIRLHDYQLLFEQDPTDEYKLHAAYRVFRQAVPRYGELIKQWVERSPNSYQPYLALAQYHYAMGWEARGGKSARQASKKQLSRMNEHLAEALTCIKRVLRINPGQLSVTRC